MWRNWNPLNPPINEQSSDDDHNNYESAGENDPNNLVSPNRPHQSPTASPRALLRPDPPPVEEVLAEVQQQLQALPNRQQRVANRNAVRQAQEAAAAAAAAAVVEEPAAMVDIDQENAQDGDKAQEHARHIKVEFTPADVIFWFSQLEAEFLLAQIKSQWLKKTVLQRNLPNQQKEDVKSYLTLTQTQAGADIYFKIKTKLIKLYAPTPQASYRKALTRTLVGLPSQLGYQLMDDVCKKPDKFDGCCCAGAVLALWTDRLPVNVRAHVSDKTFDKNTFKEVFETADQVYLSSKQVSVLAAVTTTPESLNETLPAFAAQNQPQQEVAAITRGGGRGGRGGRRNNRGGARGASSGTGRGGGQNNQNRNQNSRGQKHSSVPDSLADKMCSRHYAHGDQAWYCLAPTTCPWVSKVIART